ncbi:MAG: hypothetical protein EPO35_07545 [Acidobacteria bacterium]|nr:MAG: hypothetical protein EPO35_07545 [Acidobacteriota bacterium]
MIRFSRALAIVAGVFLPIAETTRRWHELGDIRAAPFWLDDWLIGAFLLYGAWRTRRSDPSGRVVLAAAWGFACGQVYASFFGQLALIDQADPSGLSGATVVAIKGAMFALAITALLFAVVDPQGRPRA